MKKLLLLFLVISLSLSGLQAQDISYGLKAGVNLSKFHSDDDAYNDMSEGRTGFHLGAVVEFSLSDKVSIQPELFFSSLGDKISDTMVGDSELVNVDSELQFNYISLPVMIKYYATKNIFFEAGPQLDFLSSAKGQTYFSNHFESEVVDEFDSKDHYETTSYGLSFGVGYKAENGLFLDARYQLGLSDVTKNAFVKAKNNAFQFSVGFAL